MVGCLSAKPAGAFAVSRPDLPQDGVAVIAFTPTDAPQAGSAYTVRKAGSGSQVIWRRPGNVGGLDWLDGEAHTRADRCAKS